MTITKFRVGMAALLVLGIAALFVVVGRAANTLPPGEYDLEAGQYVFNVPELVETPVPPTDTPVPPPTDTPVPSGHSNVDNHPVSAEIGHTHNEQDLLEGVFGPPGAWHNGQEISYPWQTWAGLDADPLGPSSGTMENDIKHEGYKWLVNEDADCPGSNTYGGRTGNCITDFRVLTHAAGGATGANVRLHGYSIEMRICTQDLLTCGILRTGGHGDYGPLSVFSIPGEPFGVNYVPLPNDPPEFADFRLASAPYRHHQQLGYQNIALIYNWQNDSDFGWNQVASYAFSNKDDWQGVDMNDPSRVELVCPDADCKFNHSQTHIYRMFFNKQNRNTEIVDGLDGILDGVINFSGFTDRQGNIVSACSLGPDCIPLILDNVPAGEAIFSITNRFDGGTDFDLSPPGEFWIRFPN